MAVTTRLTQQELELLGGLTREQATSLRAHHTLKSLDKSHTFSQEEQKLLRSIAAKCALRANLVKNRHKVSESLIDLWENISAFVMIMDSFFTLGTTLTLSGVLITGSIFAVLLGGVGGLSFLFAYREHKQKENKANQQYALLTLQMVCEQVVLHKEKNAGDALTDATLAQYLVVPEKTKAHGKDEDDQDERKWSRLKSTLFVGVLTASSLFYTYYAFALGLSIAFSSTAIVGAMLNPIGLGLVLGAVVVAGIYMGYKKYQFCQQQEALRHRREAAKEYFSDQREEYERGAPRSKKCAEPRPLMTDQAGVSPQQAVAMRPEEDLDVQTALMPGGFKFQVQHDD